MTLIEQIKRDREAGTPGPWVLHDAESYDGRATHHYKEVWSQDLDVIAAEVYRAHGDGGAANMKRIARVPDMEAALLAADELAAAIMQEREMVCQDMDLQAKVAKRLEMALEVYRAAVSGAAT